MVLDLQDVNATLEDVVAKSQIKLFGSSFLDTVIRDDKSKYPISILEIANDLAPIYRLDHPRDEPIAMVRVTKGKSDRSVQFGAGSWRDAEDLSSLVSSGTLAYAPNSPFLLFPLSQQPQLEADSGKLLLCTCASSPRHLPHLLTRFPGMLSYVRHL